MSIGPDLRDRVLARDGGFCRYCGMGGLRGVNASHLAIDHIVPRCRGGRDRMENLVVACKSCNTRKVVATPDELGWLILPPRYPESKHLIYDWDPVYTASAKRVGRTTKNDAWAAIDVDTLPFVTVEALQWYLDGRRAFITKDSKRRRARRRSVELARINAGSPSPPDDRSSHD